MAGRSIRRRGIVVSWAGGDDHPSTWPPSTGGLDALDPLNRAVAEFARQLTLDPKRVSESHIDALRGAGFDEAGIVELLAVVVSAKAANTVVVGPNSHPSDRGSRLSPRRPAPPATPSPG